MAFTPQRAAVIGATGPTGIYLVGELELNGTAVRAVSRSRDNLNRHFPVGDVEKIEANALDADAMRRAVDGCDLVIDCIGLPPDRMDDHAKTAEKIATAAKAVGARCLQISSFWSFLPVRRLPLDETHPREQGNRYARARREAEDIMLQSGAAVVHLPDLFGPYVHSSTLQIPLMEAAAGKTMNWIGAKDTPREYVFVPDAMATVAELLRREEAYGESWIIPGAGPLTGNQVEKIVAEHLEREASLRSAPRWVLKALSVVSSDLRAFGPILDDYLQPISYDGAKVESLLGSQEREPYEQSIPKTLDWFTTTGRVG